MKVVHKGGLASSDMMIVLNSMKLSQLVQQLWGQIHGTGYKILVRKSEGRRPLERPYRNRVGKVWTGFIWLKIGTSGGLL
jgi:hypothetical protein